MMNDLMMNDFDENLSKISNENVISPELRSIMNSKPSASDQIKDPGRLQEIVSLCKRRGFIFPSSEIYGGLQGLYDYGPLGAEIKKSLKNRWWKSMIYDRDDTEGLDSSILTHKDTLKYSGHLETFTDVMVDCLVCKCRFRIDDENLKKKDKDFICGKCGSNKMTLPRAFNLMFKTNLGPTSDEGSEVFLRPETAQGIFMNFRNILDTTSRKLPFGIAQIGKAFRNEITPRNFIFRVREFEQMELEYFVNPEQDEKWHAYWIIKRLNWWLEQGLDPKKIFLQPQDKDDLAHYSKATTDIIYKFPHGIEELEGIANRTDFDLGSHTKNQEEFKIFSKVKENTSSNSRLSINCDDSDLIPFVIEPSAGLERGIFAILDSAYCVENLENNKNRIVMKFNRHIAPIKLAIIPLAKNNPEIVEKSKHILGYVKKLNLGKIEYENTGNIGKAYRKHDEVGTPLCITVDFETIDPSHINHQTVTLRDRDSMKQTRVHLDHLRSYLLDFYKED